MFWISLTKFVRFENHIHQRVAPPSTTHGEAFDVHAQAHYLHFWHTPGYLNRGKRRKIKTISKKNKNKVNVENKNRKNKNKKNHP